MILSKGSALSSFLTSVEGANSATSAAACDSSTQRTLSEDESFENLDVEEQVKLAASSQPNDEDLIGPEEKATDEEGCG